MNKLEELLKRATIEFPFPLDAHEVKKELFVDIYLDLNSKGIDGNGSLSYNAEHHRDFSNEPSTPSGEYIRKITGKIEFSSKHHQFSSAEFELEHSSEKSNKLSAIRFFVPPGYDSIEEFAALLPSGKATIQMIEYVRKSVEDYFSKKIH